MSNSWPEADVLDALYRELCSGNPLARAAFSEAILEPLAHHLQRHHNDVHEHVRLTAAADATFALIRNPSIYDATKCSVIGFLCLSAEGDLRNEIAKEARHHRSRKSAEIVELAADDGNHSPDTRSDDLPSFDEADIAAEIASFTAIERTVFDLMRTGERATAVFAIALGFAGHPAHDQVREVKRVKDRIIQRLKRVRRKE